MYSLKIPEVPVTSGNTVVVPKDVWDLLVKYLVQVEKALNAQADELVLQSQRLSRIEGDSANLAKALGGIYDAIS